MFKYLSIAKNSFIEILRQPVYAVIITAALLLFAVSPSLAMYTMDDDNKLLRELGLSTLFISSLFIAVFAASGSIAQEIENKTLTLVLSKPVGRPSFILAKYLGVSAAVGLAHFICTIALLMTIRSGVPETVNDTADHTVLVTAFAILAGSLALSGFFNYFFDWKFSSTAMVLMALLGAVGMVFLSLMDRNWTFNPSANGFKAVDIYGSVLLLMAALLMAAIALAFSVRFNLVVTLSACVGVFLLGLISDYVFGRFAQTHAWASVGRFLAPNLQIFWVSDAIYEGSQVPISYIGMAGLYAVCYAAGILSLAVALFQRRQVG